MPRASTGPSSPSAAEPEAWSGLPGADLIAEGLQRIASGETESPSALLVAMASSTLTRLGIPVPAERLPDDPELELYRVLLERHPRGTHARYLGLVEQLDSFLRAREHQVYRARRMAAVRDRPAPGRKR